MSSSLQQTICNTSDRSSGHNACKNTRANQDSGRSAHFKLTFTRKFEAFVCCLDPPLSFCALYVQGEVPTSRDPYLTYLSSPLREDVPNRFVALRYRTRVIHCRGEDLKR